MRASRQRNFGKARARLSESFPVIAIQDGFWIHRALRQAGIESHVVDPSSITTPRRYRRAKTDRVDGETRVRTLLAFKRGESRVCSMVREPRPRQEDLTGRRRPAEARQGANMTRLPVNEPYAVPLKTGNGKINTSNPTSH